MYILCAFFDVRACGCWVWRRTSADVCVVYVCVRLRNAQNLEGELGQYPIDTNLEGELSIYPIDTNLEGELGQYPIDTNLEGELGQYPIDTNLEGELSVYPIDTVRH